MGRIVYVNGEYPDEADAVISIFDRGFLMADAVYEVTCVLDGKLIDFAGHLKRLHRSLRELDIPAPVDDREIEQIHRKLLTLNRLKEGVIYLQVTRGAADRDLIFSDDLKPGLVLFTQEKSIRNAPVARTGIRVISVPDIRWARRDIKTVQLLASSLAKIGARKAGKEEAWMVEDGFVTEGSSNNAYIVTRAGLIVTRDLSSSILHGITRAAVMDIARQENMALEERPFTIEEARNAAEAFITSSSTFVTPVIEIDGTTLGDGTPGPVAKRLREIYIAESLKNAV